MVIVNMLDLKAVGIINDIMQIAIPNVENWVYHKALCQSIAMVNTILIDS